MRALHTDRTIRSTAIRPLNESNLPNHLVVMAARTPPLARWTTAFVNATTKNPPDHLEVLQLQFPSLQLASLTCSTWLSSRPVRVDDTNQFTVVPRQTFRRPMWWISWDSSWLQKLPCSHLLTMLIRRRRPPIPNLATTELLHSAAPPIQWRRTTALPEAVANR